MKSLRTKAVSCFAATSVAVCVALGALASQAVAQGMSILKLGWTYDIAFPDVQIGPLPVNRVEPGIHTYRILAFGGDQWYRVQRVYRHENGGWLSVPNTDNMWVNMGYAFAITEVVR